MKKALGITGIILAINITADASNNETFSANFTIVNGGREVDFISTATGDIITGAAKLQ